MRRTLIAGVLIASCGTAQGTVTVASKSFPESLVLGEIATRMVATTGVHAEHRRGLGSTRIVWEALLAGSVDVYPDYTGTLRRELFADRALKGDAELRAELAKHGIGMTQPLGFDNTYVIGVTRPLAARLRLERVSDLRAHPELRFGFSHEFLNRADGWPGLRARYGLPQTDVRGLEHNLAYEGLTSGAIDAMELYSTDAKVKRLDLVALDDDRGYFPQYLAVFVYRRDLEARAPGAIAALRRVSGRIDTPAMVAMNDRVEAGASEALVAADFVERSFGIVDEAVPISRAQRIVAATLDHLCLVAVSLLLAVSVAIPAGVFAAERPRLGQGILALAGVVQTIPSIALLVLMIPVFGLGAGPAVVALFLYSLLPILRNTYTGLRDIPQPLRESARALGLSTMARLRRIDLPLALPSVLAGIKIAAVINIGTATLGGFIGAGGYGELIFRGLTMRRDALVLEGAVPAAVLALLAQALFEVLERRLVTRPTTG